MRFRFLHSLLIWGSVVLAISPVSRAEQPKQLPAEILFAPPLISRPRISPDGRYVAYLAPMEGRAGIALFDVATGKAEKLVRAEENIDAFFWKGAEHLVFLADVAGNEAFAGQVIHIKTRRISRLFESFGDNNAERQAGNVGGIVETWPSNPRKIIVSGTKEASSWTIGLFAVDLSNGRKSPVPGISSAERENIVGMVFDNAGRLRVRARVTPTAIVFEARLGESTSFTVIETRPRDLIVAGVEDLDAGQILSDDRTLVYVSHAESDRGELVSWDLDKGQNSGVIFAPPVGEIVGFTLSADRSRVESISYEAEKPSVHWLDPELRQIQQSIDSGLAQTLNHIVSRSGDNRRLVVFASSDREPGVYLLLDRTRVKPLLMPIGSVNPQVTPDHFSPMETVAYQARDGLTIHGYLTRPVHSREGRAPLVIMPHGGPYGIRDSWEFSADVQFLASRGYVVLQPNYRGSGGYGRTFLEAGRHEWGGKMQQDLEDAVRWAVDEGIADPNRVAIYGGSYGGYAALAGVTFTPGLYRCAVNYVGVSDLTLLGRRDRGGSRIFNELYYEPWIHASDEILRGRSPVNHVEKIQVPTLHAYGENDPRVEIRHWKSLQTQLDRFHKPYEFLRETDEGHGFQETSAKIRFYQAVEVFLAKHLQGS